MIKPKKEKWIFCYWDDSSDNKSQKPKDGSKNNTRREEGPNKT